MTPEEITERNKQIALMMGAVPEQWYPPSEPYKQSGVHFAFPQGGWYPNNQRHHCKELLKFHSDWNWLMEVVEFIESKEWHIVINKNDCSIFNTEHAFSSKGICYQTLAKNKQEAVFITVSIFASLYYNKQL